MNIDSLISAQHHRTLTSKISLMLSCLWLFSFSACAHFAVSSTKAPPQYINDYCVEFSYDDSRDDNVNDDTNIGNSNTPLLFVRPIFASWFPHILSQSLNNQLSSPQPRAPPRFFIL